MPPVQAPPGAVQQAAPQQGAAPQGQPALVMGSLSPGERESQTQNAKDVVENYNTLHSFATQSAPRNIGLLQSIQQLADKTLTGYGSDKLQFVNGVLNMMHITPGADAAQNYSIMEKNLNMLVGSQRMGAAGGGSDALQKLLEASNPNVATMNAPALKEAASELIAYNRMMMDKDRLAPNPTKVSSQAYQQFESDFAPFHDPRMWEMQHAATDAERKRILQKIPEDSRALFLSRANEAIKRGVLGKGM